MTERDVSKTLEERVARLETRQDNIWRALWGDPAMQQSGYVKEMESAFAELSDDIKEAKTIVQQLRDERREEVAERRGMKRIVGYSGVTNLLTLATLIAVVYSLYTGLAGA